MLAELRRNALCFFVSEGIKIQNKMAKVKYYAYGANGTTDPMERYGSKNICSSCSKKFSFWDDLQMRYTDEKLLCSECKGIEIDLITKPE